MLLCSNARTYNEEGSLIYSDSIELENGFLMARAELEAMELEEGEGPDEPGEEGSTVVEVDYMSDNSDSEPVCIVIECVCACTTSHRCTSLLGSNLALHRVLYLV